LQRAQGTRPGPVDRECRLFFIQLYRWFPSVLNAITIVRPETLLRSHHEGFRRYWRWNQGIAEDGHHLGGTACVDPTQSLENKLWGAPHIHGELLRLGLTVAQFARDLRIHHGQFSA